MFGFSGLGFSECHLNLLNHRPCPDKICFRVLVSSYKAFYFLFNNTWQSDVQFFFWGKILIIFKTVTSAQLSGEKSTMVLKITLKFLFAEEIKENIYCPKVFTNHWKKITLIALQRNSYWESIRLIWA